MKHLREDVKKASDTVVKELAKNQGLGGVIALDNRGNGESDGSSGSLSICVLIQKYPVALSLNSSGMYRGVIRVDGAPKVAIFDDEDLA